MIIFCIKNKKFKKIILSLIILSFCIILSIFSKCKIAETFSERERRLPIYSVDTGDKKVAITFDASWGENNTVKILDILDKYKIKATFFLVGRWIDDFPEETREIYKRGHEIGNHSNKHPMMTEISKQNMINEIAETDAKIMTITGKKTTLFRCPSGAYNDEVINTVEGTGHYCIQWNVDSIDWKNGDANAEYNRVIKKAKPGSILLFHNAAVNTPSTLPKIIEYLKGKGYKFVTVSDLIYKSNYYIDYTGKQKRN